MAFLLLTKVFAMETVEDSLPKSRIYGYFMPDFDIVKNESTWWNVNSTKSIQSLEIYTLAAKFTFLAFLANLNTEVTYF